MLQRQNDRLSRALRCMAARIDTLESAHTGSSRASRQAGPSLTTADDAASNISHASIAEILEHYAPELSDATDCQANSEEFQHQETLMPNSFTQQMPGSKKRRVQDVTVDGGDVVPEHPRPPHMSMPYPALQDSTSGLTASKITPSGSGEHVANGRRTDPPPLPLEIPDNHLQAYQAFLHMSQAHKGWISNPAALSGMQSSDGMERSSLETIEQPLAMDMTSTSTNNGFALGNECFQGPLLDLVDWHASLQNCEPMFWDWQQDGQ